MNIQEMGKILFCLWKNVRHHLYFMFLAGRYSHGNYSIFFINKIMNGGKVKTIFHCSRLQHLPFHYSVLALLGSVRFILCTFPNSISSQGCRAQHSIPAFINETRRACDDDLVSSYSDFIRFNACHVLVLPRPLRPFHSSVSTSIKFIYGKQFLFTKRDFLN